MAWGSEAITLLWWSDIAFLGALQTCGLMNGCNAKTGMLAASR